MASKSIVRYVEYGRQFELSSKIGRTEKDAVWETCQKNLDENLCFKLPRPPYSPLEFLTTRENRQAAQ